MSRERVAVAAHAIGAFNAREIDTFAALTTPDFQWSPSMVAVEGETFLGREGIESTSGGSATPGRRFTFTLTGFESPPFVWQGEKVRGTPNRR
jgi:hypothetical protein